MKVKLTALFCLWAALTTCVQIQAFVQPGCIHGLPEFVDRGSHSQSLLVGIQALVPSYEFTCHGKIARWGIATQRSGQHNISLQVWRAASRPGSHAYSLVGANSVEVRPPKDHALVYISPPPEDQITVLPGDVVGFYLQNNITTNDDFSVQYQSHANNATLHFVTTDQPLTVIEETTLSIQMSQTAPIMTVDIDLFTSPLMLPTTTTLFRVSTRPGVAYPSITAPTTSQYNYSYTMYTINVHTAPLYTDESSSTSTAAILGVTLGILAIAVVLAVVGIILVCKKTGTSVAHEERLRHTTNRGNQTTLKGVSMQDMRPTSFTEYLIKENPAYRHGLQVPVSSSDRDQALEYETPVAGNNEETSLMTTSHEYDVPRQVHARTYEYHDYDEVLY